MTPRPWEPEAVAQRRAERRQRGALLIAAGTTAIVVLFAVVVAIVGGDDDPDGQAGATTRDSTGSTAARSTTSARRSTTTAGRSTTTAGGVTTTDRSGGSSSSGPAATTTPGATTIAAPTTVGAPTSAAPSPSPLPTDGGPTTTPTTAAPTPTAAPGTLDNPVRLGTAAPIGEGWELTVNAYVPDATADVLAEDEFNEPPDDGFQYALATVAVTYNGSDPTTSMFEVDVGVMGPDGFETDMFSCPAIAPKELDTAAEVSPGDTVTGNVCFMLPTATAASMVMYGTAGFVNDDIYFALT